jgi:four helix bundle protein
MNEKSDTLSERLLGFAATVIKITDGLPNTVAGRHVAGQLIRAGTSCGSNYEEACGAESRSDFAHKMSIVLKELKESRFWLRLFPKRKCLPLTALNPSWTNVNSYAPWLRKAFLRQNAGEVQIDNFALLILQFAMIL